MSFSNEVVARICHEANRALTQEVKDVPVQPPWDDTPEEQRTSCVDGVAFLRAHPDAPASASHDNWLAFKRAQGWKWGPTKDETKKEHPAMVPFDELPAGVRQKDVLFRAIVEAFSK